MDGYAAEQELQLQHHVNGSTIPMSGSQQQMAHDRRRQGSIHKQASIEVNIFGIFLCRFENSPDGKKINFLCRMEVLSTNKSAYRAISKIGPKLLAGLLFLAFGIYCGKVLKKPSNENFFNKENWCAKNYNEKSVVEMSCRRDLVLLNFSLFKNFLFLRLKLPRKIKKLPLQSVIYSLKIFCKLFLSVRLFEPCNCL